MDPLVSRMFERNSTLLQQLPENVAENAAENARLREKQLLEAYYSGLGCAGRCEMPGTISIETVFKIPHTSIGKKQPERFGKENKTPLKQSEKANSFAIPPRQFELYPKRPPRSVYNSPLLDKSIESPQVFEKRYKMKSSTKCSQLRGASTNDMLHANLKKSSGGEILKTVKSTSLHTLNQNNTTGNAKTKFFGNPYPSLPKIDTSYDLDRLANRLLAAQVCKNSSHQEQKEDWKGEVPATQPVNVQVNVKKIIEKFNQSPGPIVSPMKVPRIDKCTRSPLASSTMKSPVRVVPKLYILTEPSKPEIREVGNCVSPSDENSPDVAEHEKERVDLDIQEENKTELNSSLGSSSSIRTHDASTTLINEQNGYLSARFDDDENHQRQTALDSSAISTKLSIDSKILTNNEKDREKCLTMEASVQRSLVAQTSKALYLCRSAKQFRDSKELVEGERILLLASLRYHAALEEIKKCNEPILSNSVSRGSISISNIVVPLKWDIVPKLDQTLCPQWFVCVLIYREKVEATEVVRLGENEPALRFKGTIQLSDLTSDFRARLQLYAFRSPHCSRKSKSKIVQACKMLRRPTRNCLGPAGSSEELIYLRHPAFTMIGCTEVTVQLLTQCQPVACSLGQVPMVSLIKGTISFRLTACLLKTRKSSGFLNVLRPAGQGHTWQRWWCHLDGRFIRSWNYPSDQDHKDPESVLDLQECSADKVVPAPRVLCSRPRTLMLESKRSRAPCDLDSTLLACSADSTIVRHFLSCDTAAEMTEWSSALNECLRALHMWNIPSEATQEKKI